MGGVYIDGRSIGLGLSLLGDAFRNRRRNKAFQEAQIATTLFGQLSDPNTDIETRNRLKQQLAEHMEIEDPTSLSDDLTQLTNQIDLAAKQKYGSVFTDGRNAKVWNGAMEAAKANGKLLKLKEATESQVGSMPRMMQEQYQLLGEAGLTEAQVTMSMNWLEKRSSAIGGLAVENELMSTPEYQANRKAKLNEALEEAELKMYNTHKFKTKYGLYGSRGGSGSGGTGGGRGGKKLQDGQQYRNGTDLVQAAIKDIGYGEAGLTKNEARLNEVQKERQNLVEDLLMSGIDPDTLANTEVGKVLSVHGEEVPLSAGMVVDVLASNNWNGDASYDAISEMYPDITKDQWSSWVSEYGSLTATQRQSYNNYSDVHAERERIELDIDSARLQLEQANQKLALALEINDPDVNVSQVQELQVLAKNNLEKAQLQANSAKSRIAPGGRGDLSVTPDDAPVSSTFDNVIENVSPVGDRLASSWKALTGWVSDTGIADVASEIGDRASTGLQLHKQVSGGGVVDAISGLGDRPTDKTVVVQKQIGLAKNLAQTIPTDEFRTQFDSIKSFTDAIFDDPEARPTKEELDEVREIWRSKWRNQ